MKNSVAGPLLIIASPIVFLLLSSLALMTYQKWWSDAYLTSEFRWSWAWWFYAQQWHSLPNMAKLTVAATALFGACMAFGLVRLGFGQKKSNLYGKAKWQTMLGAIKSGLTFSLRPKPDGILLGVYRILWFRLYVSLRGDMHVSLTASTGAGKGVSFVIPNVLNWAGPVFCFSVKRDVLKACAAERERKGDKVFVFDLTDPNGETHCRSGFGESDRDSVDIYDDIQRIMWTIIPETKANNPYWDNAARKVATAIGVMLAETPGETLNISRIAQVIGASDHEAQIKDMIYRARAEKRPFQLMAVETVMSWLNNKAEEGAAAVRENILTALALWNSPRIASATSRDDFRLTNICAQRISVFVCAQPGDIRRLRPIYSLLFTQLMQKNTQIEWKDRKRKREAPALIMLDERWALGEMKELDDAFAFVRSYGLRFGLVLQNKKQLYAAIGEHGAKNIFDNTYVELIFGGTDQDTAEEVSKRSAVNTVEEHSTSKPKFFGMFNPSKYNENLRSAARPLLLPQEVSRLPRTKVIAQIKGEPPLLLDRIFWYEDDNFRTMSNGKTPPMPKLKINVMRDMGTDIGV